MDFSRINSTGRGLRALSFVMGAFLLLMGVNKIQWLTDSEFLVYELNQWLGLAPEISRLYLETIAIPGAHFFAPLVVLGELLAGAALLLGYRVRSTAMMALVMVLNFHFASGIIFTFGYLTNGYGPPVIGSLLALGIGGGRLPLALSR